MKYVGWAFYTDEREYAPGRHYHHGTYCYDFYYGSGRWEIAESYLSNFDEEYDQNIIDCSDMKTSHFRTVNGRHPPGITADRYTHWSMP